MIVHPRARRKRRRSRCGPSGCLVFAVKCEGPSASRATFDGTHPCTPSVGKQRARQGQAPRVMELMRSQLDAVWLGGCPAAIAGYGVSHNRNDTTWRSAQQHLKDDVHTEELLHLVLRVV